jgi:hypothetical protein
MGAIVCLLDVVILVRGYEQDTTMSAGSGGEGLKVPGLRLSHKY